MVRISTGARRQSTIVSDTKVPASTPKRRAARPSAVAAAVQSPAPAIVWEKNLPQTITAGSGATANSGFESSSDSSSSSSDSEEDDANNSAIQSDHNNDVAINAQLQADAAAEAASPKPKVVRKRAPAKPRAPKTTTPKDGGERRRIHGTKADESGLTAVLVEFERKVVENEATESDKLSDRIEFPNAAVTGPDVVISRADYTTFSDAVISSISEIQASTAAQIASLQHIHTAASHFLNGFRIYKDAHLGSHSQASASRLNPDILTVDHILRTQSSSSTRATVGSNTAVVTPAVTTPGVPKPKAMDRMLILQYPDGSPFMAIPAAAAGDYITKYGFDLTELNDSDSKKGKKSSGAGTVSAGEGKITKKQAKKERDPNMPTRPGTSYLLYCQTFRPKVKDELVRASLAAAEAGVDNGTDTVPGEVSNNVLQAELSRRWTDLSESAKQVWRDRYQSLFADYTVRMNAYKEQIGGSGIGTELSTPVTGGPLSGASGAFSFDSIPGTATTTTGPAAETDVDADVEDEPVAKPVKRTRARATKKGKDAVEPASAVVDSSAVVVPTPNLVPAAPTASARKRKAKEVVEEPVSTAHGDIDHSDDDVVGATNVAAPAATTADHDSAAESGDDGPSVSTTQKRKRSRKSVPAESKPDGKKKKDERKKRKSVASAEV